MGIYLGLDLGFILFLSRVSIIKTKHYPTVVYEYRRPIIHMTPRIANYCLQEVSECNVTEGGYLTPSWYSPPGFISHREANQWSYIPIGRGTGLRSMDSANCSPRVNCWTSNLHRWYSLFTKPRMSFYGPYGSYNNQALPYKAPVVSTAWT